MPTQTKGNSRWSRFHLWLLERFSRLIPFTQSPWPGPAGVTDVSFSLFFLLALYLYINSRQTWISIIASAVAFFAALLCKEPAITLPVVLVAYDLFLRREKFSLGRCALRQVPYVAAIAIYMVLRVQALGGFAPVSTEASFTLYHYVINVMALFSRYLEALVLPLNLNFWHIFRPVTSLASLPGSSPYWWFPPFWVLPCSHGERAEPLCSD